MAANMPFREEAPKIFCRQWRGAIFDKGNFADILRLIVELRAPPDPAPA